MQITDFRGMTLIELVVCTLMIGILASTALPVSQKFVRYEKEKLLNERLREIRTAIDRFYLHTSGKNDAGEEQARYPRSFDELIQKRFLRKIPIDPLTGKAEWKKISTTDDKNAEISDGLNIFDVRSKSDKIGSNNIPYSQW
jgi:general secretion pathway protein G